MLTILIDQACTDSLVLCSYEVPLGYPVLPTFPPVFSKPPASKSLAVNATLSTSPSIAKWIRSLQRAVSAEATGTVLNDREEREAVAQDLAVLAESYVEGWEGGEDSEDDD